MIGRRLKAAFAALTAPQERRSGVEAAGGGRRWSASGSQWLPSPQSSLLAARGTVQSRASGAYVNAAYGQRITEAWTAALVGGGGWQARSQHSDPDTRRRLSAEFESLVQPLLPALARGLVRDGEAFCRLVPTDGGSLELRLLPSDQVDATLTRDLGGGARIIAGIEHDSEDRVVAYHILREAPSSPLPGAHPFEAQRIPASDILHVYDQQFPGQIRGISWLSPVLLKLTDRDALSDALLVQAKCSAALTAFITSPEPDLPPSIAPDSYGEMELSPGAIHALRPGEDVKFTDPPAASQSVDFMRSLDREIAAGAGLSYEMLTGDLAEASYSSARVSLLEFRRRAEMLQQVLIVGQFLRPLWARWISVQALAGAITADPESLAEYRSARFIAPGWSWIDPLKEANAEIRSMEAGIRSRAEIVAARGRDLDELDQEIAADRLRTADQEDAA